MTFIFCSSVCAECEAPILFCFVFRGYSERKLCHSYHQNEEKDEVEWHYLKAYSIAEQPEQRNNGQKYAEHRDYPRPEPSVHPVGHQTRSYRSAGYDHGDDAHIRNRHSELEVHDGPARAEKRIGQSEADKGKIDKCKQKRIHFGSP